MGPLPISGPSMGSADPAWCGPTLGALCCPATAPASPPALQGIFSFNLTLAEVKTLRAKQRVDIRCAAAALLMPMPWLLNRRPDTGCRA